MQRRCGRAVGNGGDGHPGSLRRLAARDRIFQRQTGLGLTPNRFRRQQVNVRRWFAKVHFVTARNRATGCSQP
jgi:hypothetical protein